MDLAVTFHLSLRHQAPPPLAGHRCQSCGNNRDLVRACLEGSTERRYRTGELVYCVDWANKQRILRRLNVAADDGVAARDDTTVPGRESVTANDGITTGDDTAALNLGAVTPDDGIAADDDIGTRNPGVVTTDDSVATDDDIVAANDRVTAGDHTAALLQCRHR